MFLRKNRQRLGRIKKYYYPDAIMPYSFLNNNGINFIDVLGLVKWHKSCDCYLSKKEQEGIDGYVLSTKNIIQSEIANGWELDNTEYVPKYAVLSEFMARKIIDIIDKIEVKCLGNWNPICWSFPLDASAAAIPGTSTIRICAKKLRDKNSADSFLSVFSGFIYHETTHTRGKWGHTPPDDPYQWQSVDEIYKIKNNNKEILTKNPNGTE